MKKVLLALFGIITLLPSCSTKLDINAPYQDETVVYGLLDAKSDTQYVRIEKGFIDNTKSAITLAAIPDSIYYGDILVVVLKAEGSSFSDTLHRTTAIPKDSGTFANVPNVLYFTTNHLDPSKTYDLTITNRSSGKVISSKTGIVGDFSTVFPPQDTSLSIEVPLVGPSTNSNKLSVTWVSAANAQLYGLNIRFHYIEWDKSNPSVKDTLFFDWPVFNNATSNGSGAGQSLHYELSVNDFYSLLLSKVKVDPNKERLPLARPLDFTFTAGGPDLYSFLQATQAQLGLTSLQAQTKYTNITNGFGIFSSRTSITASKMKMTARTLDSLACSSATRSLNFVIPGTPCN